MGAGAVTSNVKSDKSLVVVHAEDKDVATGFKKFGAILGDGVEVGCNSVLNPGTVVGKESNIYPFIQRKRLCCCSLHLQEPGQYRSKGKP